MSLLCVTLHFFRNDPRSREPAAEQSHHAQKYIMTALVVMSIGFFPVSGISPCQQDCNGLWTVFQQLDIPPSLSLLLRNTVNKWVMDQNSGQAISQVIRTNCFWTPCTSGSSWVQLLHQKRSRRPAVPVLAPTAAAKPGGLTIGVA